MKFLHAIMAAILFMLIWAWLVTPAKGASRSFSPSGDVAKYRYTGYWEAVTIISKTDILSEEARLALVNLLMDAPEMGQYVVEAESE